MGAEAVLGVAYAVVVMLLVARVRRERVQAVQPSARLWVAVGFVVGIVSVIVLAAVSFALLGPR